MTGGERASAPRANARRWLLGLIAVSTVLRATLALTHGCPIVFHDELIYSDMAKSFAATGSFAVREAHCPQQSLVYPLLIWPAYALFDSIPDAYAMVKILNALLMSLAAIPAYFLARRLLDATASLFVAGLSVAVPSMMYTATVMTENAFYPISLFFALAVVRTLERPTIGRQVVVIALLGAAILTRTQGVALVGAVVTIFVGFAWSEARASREARFLRGVLAYWPTWTLLLGTAAFLVIQASRGGGVDALLGAYAHHDLRVPAIGRLLRLFANHVGGLDLATGVLPFAAFLILSVIGLVGDASRPVRILAVVTVALFLWLTAFSALWIAAVGGRYRILERTIFHVSPLFFIALFWWIRRERRSWPIAAAAAVLAAGIPALITNASIGQSFDSPILFAVETLRSVGGESWTRLVVVLLATAGCVSIALLVPRRLGHAAPAIVALYFTVAFVLVEKRLTGISAGVQFHSIDESVDWIDRAVPGDASVAVIWTPTTPPTTVWVNEFFNRRVGAIYTTGQRFPGWPAQTALRLDASGRYLDPGGEPVITAYALAEQTTPLAGEVIARDAKSNLILYRTNGPLCAPR